MTVDRGQRWDARPMGLAVGVALLLLAASVSSLALARERGADGEFEKRTSSHFVLYQDVDIDRTSGFRGSRRFEQQVLAALESGYDEVDHYLGLRPARPITVVVYDPAVFDGSFSGLFRFPAAGFYEGRVHIRGDTVVSDRLVRVLHHELVHASFAAEARSLPVPAWLNEGTAEWFAARVAGKRRLSVAERGRLERVAQGGNLFSLRELALPSFAGLGPQGARLAYLQAYAFVEYLVRAHGERSLRELIGHYVRTGNLERALRRSYRADLSSLEELHLAELRDGKRH